KHLPRTAHCAERRWLHLRAYGGPRHVAQTDSGRIGGNYRKLRIFAIMNVDKLLSRALDFEFLSISEGVHLYHHAPLADLSYVANTLRKIQVPHGKVTWQIDRNVNTTNVCIANCKFCNFFRRPGHEESYITDIDTYKRKIEETFRYGGDQLLLQGGHHPELGLAFYAD